MGSNVGDCRVGCLDELGLTLDARPSSSIITSRVMTTVDCMLSFREVTIDSEQNVCIDAQDSIARDEGKCL